MAKLTIEEAKTKLAPIAKTIEMMKAAGIEINQILTDEFNRLTKIIEGSAGNKSADWFNLNIGAQLNQSPSAITSLKANGTSGRLRWSIVTDEAGVETVKFESGSAGSAGGQKSGTASGGTKAATPFNHYEVTVKTDLPDYKETSGTFTTASKAVEFVLNNGKNPMNLGAEWQAGNSMVRALQSLGKVKEFTDNFELVCSYVAVAPKATEPVAEPTV